MDIADLDLPPVEKMSRRKKWWIVGGVCAFLGLLVFLYLKDDALKDDSDLMGTLPEIPEEENGLRFFTQLSPPFDSDDEDFQKLNGMLSGDEYGNIDWEPEFAAQQVERFRYLMDALKAAAAAPSIRFAPRETEFDSTNPDRSLLHSALTLARVAAKLAQEEGDTAEVLKQIGILNATGEKLMAGTRSILDLIYARLAIGSGVDLLSELVTNELTDVDASILEAIENAAKTMSGFASSARQAYDGEYRIAKATIFAVEDTGELLGRSFPMILLKKNRTVNTLADFCRDSKAAIGKPLKEIGDPALARSMKMTPVKMILSGNLTGEAFLGMIGSPNMDRSVRVPLQSRIEILQVMVALRRYHQGEGQLPDTLMELVPEYLAVLPADRYDGGDLHYDKVRAKVWCVGKDLVNDGAPDEEEGTSFKRMEDPGMQLKWLANEKPVEK